MRRIELTERDIRFGEKIIKKELINPLTWESMFLGAVYCILSISESHKKQTRIYDELKNFGLTTPQSIKNHVDQTRNILKKARFPNKKEGYILGLCDVWLESGIPEKILEDVNNGREQEFELREEIVRSVPGMGYKTASFLMQKCGYELVAVIDIWMLRFLKMLGENVKVSDYYKISGLTAREYLDLEKKIWELAEEYGIKTNVFQATVWGKYSKSSDLYAQTTLDEYYLL